MVLYNFKKIVIESLPILIFSAVVSTISGSALYHVIEDLLAKPYFLVLIPPVGAVAGNLGSIFSSRINSALHIGTIEPKLGKYKQLQYDIVLLSLLSVVSFFTLGLFSYYFCILFNIEKIAFFDVLLISLILSILFSIIIIFVSTTVAFLSFKHGLDPDNTVIPVITTVCDFAGIFSLILLITVI